MYKRHRVERNKVEEFLNSKIENESLICAYVCSNDGKIDIITEESETKVSVFEDVPRVNNADAWSELKEWIVKTDSYYIHNGYRMNSCDTLKSVLDQMEIIEKQQRKRVCEDFNCKIDLFGCQGDSCNYCDYHTCRGCVHLFECITDDAEGMRRHIEDNFTMKDRERF